MDPAEIDACITLHYPAYWLKVDLPQKIAHAPSPYAAHVQKVALLRSVPGRARRDRAHGGGAGSSVAALHHRRRCAVAGANIVDAQIFTTTDGRALDTISVSREFEHDTDEAPRARITDSIEKALRGDLQLPEVVAKRGARRRG